MVGCFLRGKSLSVGELEELVDLFERSHARLKWLQVRAEIQYNSPAQPSHVALCRSLIIIFNHYYL